MPIREKPASQSPRIRDAALRIPRTAKDAAKNLNRSAEDIRERGDDTPEQYAESKMEQAGQALAGRARSLSARALRDVAKRGQERSVRSVHGDAAAQGNAIGGSPSSRYGTGGESASMAGGSAQTGAAQIGAPSGTLFGSPPYRTQASALSRGGLPSGGLPRSHSSGPLSVHRLHIRYRTGYARRKPPQPSTQAGSRAAPFASSPLQASSQEPQDARGTRYAQDIIDTAKARRDAERLRGTAQKRVGDPGRGPQNARGLRSPRGLNASVRFRDSAGKTVKSGTRTVKTAKRTVRTAQRTVKTAAQTARHAKQAVRTAKQMAVQTAGAVKAAAKATVRLVTFALKALVAVAKAIAAAIAAGGWVAVLIITVVAAAAVVLFSAFGVFFADQLGDNPSMPEVMAAVEADMRAKVRDAIGSAGSDAAGDGTAGVDRVVIDQDGDGGLVQNWRDILAVYAVRTADGGTPAILVTDGNIDVIRQITLDMNRIDYRVETETTAKTVTGSDGSASQEAVTEKVLYLSVAGKDARTQATEYGFTARQTDLLETLLSAEFRPYFTEMLGLEPVMRPSREDLDIILHDLPEGALGSEIVKLALTRLGDAYDYGHSAGGGPGEKVDCSAFTQWAYAQCGISMPRTAAAQAKYCADNRLTVSFADLVPGDLVFFSHGANGRFMDITHVAVYAGDGMVVDSSSGNGEVVYRELYGGQVLYGRPHIAQR